MELPKRIYKYQPATIRALESLHAASLWFADPKSFNDPFDCALDTIKYAIEKGFSKCDVPTAIEILQQMNLEPEVMKKILQQKEDRIRQLAANCVLKNQKIIFHHGVACFSETFDNLLMWGHYGASHHGFCLEFATDCPPFDDPMRLRAVQYQDLYPAFDPSRLAHGDFDHFLEFLLTKATYWSYEREWRLIHREVDQVFNYPRKSLKAIYFGARMPESQMGVICHLLKESDTKTFRMRIGQDSFTLKATEEFYVPIDYRSVPQNTPPE